MNRLEKLAGALALVLLLPAAGLAQSTGSADFTRYVAIGDSLTAGFWSGGLVQTYQKNSYPALISRQATANPFEQPLVGEPGIPPVLGLVSLSPLIIAPTGGSNGPPLNLALPRPYNNLGVPGARVHDTVATTTGGLHDLILRNPAFGNTSALQQAAGFRATFATVWIGNNDVLAAATSGRVIEGVTLTPLASFEADYRTIVNTLSAVGTKYVLANIPSVTSIPFVTTLPYIIINPATSQPVLINGQPVPLIGPNGPLSPNDHVLLTAQAELAQGRGIPLALGGSGQPLSDGVVLSADETRIINERLAQYNALIATVAREKNVPVVDVNASFAEVAAHGLPIGGITFTGAFLTGGLFSYDGVHASAIGYAYLANLFVDAINRGYGADLEPVDLYSFVFGKSGDLEPIVGEPFHFTREAGVSLLRSLGVPQWVIDGRAKPPKRPRGRR